MNLKDREQDILKCFIVTFIIGVIAYGYVFANFTPNHDGMMTVTMDQNWQMSIGRFMMKYYIKIRGAVDAPWFIGMLSLIYVSASVYLVMEILGISFDTWRLVTVSSVMTLSIAYIASAATFIYLLDMFCLALLFSVLSVYCSECIRGYVGIITSILFLALSMGLYQAYIGVTVGLYMVLTILHIADSDDLKLFFKSVIRWCILLALAGITYWLMLKCALYINGIEMYSDSYNSVDNVGKMNIIQIVQLIPACYIEVINVIFKEYTYSTIVPALLSIVIAIFGIISWIAFVNNKISGIVRKMLFFLVFLSFPIGINVVFLVSGGMMHQLMMYPYQFVYLLLLCPILVFDDLGIKDKLFSFIKKSEIVLVLLLSLFIIRFSNDLFYYQHLVGEGTNASITNILYDIERTPGYDPDKNRIAVIGNPTSSLSQNYEMRWILGNTSGIGTNGTTITYNEVFNWYLKNILGRDYPYTYDNDEISLLREIEDVINMPIYPEKGYCKMVDDYLIIKFDE